ncbi:hypothetical protein TNCV_3775991 [Trichonephila clavipes]|nr:hypothetical protein TNCV_3775991 [Trichonephila clavipes]
MLTGRSRTTSCPSRPKAFIPIGRHTGFGETSISPVSRHQFLNGKSEFLVYENENKIDGERQRESASAQNGWRRGTEADERRYPKKKRRGGALNYLLQY